MSDNPKAFPGSEFVPNGMTTVNSLTGEHTSQGRTVIHAGMTLRDWFAGQALAGLAQRGMPASFGNDLEKWQAAMARSCFGLADAMLAAREQKA